uniref:Uncharacterized protein n=1 Tax=Anguilla anguilla TaxID=7936 RepID=A0A0E9SS45_ANGAN
MCWSRCWAKWPSSFICCLFQHCAHRRSIGKIIIEKIQ